MFMEVGESHHTPHFHAYYQEHVAVFGIDPVECLAGELPRTQRRLVEAWVSFTGPNCRPTGSVCSLVGHRFQSVRYNRIVSTHAIHRVQSFERVGPFALRVAFADGSEQTIDFVPVLVGELYGPLRDPEVFASVQLDPEVHTLVWPNGADFDPATLHDWPTVADELAVRARAWAKPVDVAS